MGSKTKKRFHLLWIEYKDEIETGNKIFTIHKNEKQAMAFANGIGKNQKYSHNKFWLPRFNTDKKSE